MPGLDKAKEIVVEKIFGYRQKLDSHDRNLDTDRQHSRDDVCEKGRNKDKDRGQGGHEQGPGAVDSNRPAAAMVSNITQTPLKGADDVIVEYPSSAFSRPSPDALCKSRKREYEADSNSGTWPKSRSGLVISSTVPSTVTVVPAKERPSIKDPGLFQPSQQRESSTGSGGGYSADRNGVCHSQQNSDSGGVKYPVGVVGSQPSIPSPKGPPHFSVRVTQAPVAVGRPMFPKQRPGQGPPIPHQNSQYPSGSHGTPTSYPHLHPRHQPPHLQPGLHSHLHPRPKPSQSEAYPATLHPQRVTSKGNSHRPTSAPHRSHHVDKQWPPAPSWPHHLGPASYSHPYSPISLPPESGVPTSRPTSLEVPYPVRLSEVPGEEGRMASPIGSSVGSGLSGRSLHPSSQHHYPAVR